MSDRDRVVRELHDVHSDCPGFVATGTCDGLCGWMEGYRRAYDAGRADGERDTYVMGVADGRIMERADVVAWLRGPAYEAHADYSSLEVADAIEASEHERGAHHRKGQKP